MKTNGVRPEKPGPIPTWPIIHCERCRAPIVVAWDDWYQASDNLIYTRRVDFDPVLIGDCLLWFEVDNNGDPVGRQNFTRIAEVDPAQHRGPTWRFHAGTCGKQGGGR